MDSNLNSIILIFVVGGFLAGLYAVRVQLRKRAFVKLRAEHASRKNAKIRSTDTGDNSKNQALLVEEAESLIKSKQPIRAARCYKQAGMFREAISTLEDAGEIERACHILYEMERPNRAGAMYERHRHFEEATAAYLKAGLQGDAARCLETAAADKPELYAATAQIYKSLGKSDKVLDIYATAALFDDYVRYAYREAAWSQLRDFMSEEPAIKAIFSRVDFGMVRAFIRELPLDRHTAQCLALWTKTVKKLELVEISIKRLAKQKELLGYYWSLLPAKQIHSICEKIAAVASKEGKDGMTFILFNAASLYDSDNFTGASILYKAANRHLMVAKCFSHLGQLEEALQCLHESGDQLLEKSFQNALGNSPDPEIEESGARIWCEEAKHQALKVLENANPERDEVERQSPFVLAG